MMEESVNTSIISEMVSVMSRLRLSHHSSQSSHYESCIIKTSTARDKTVTISQECEASK